MNVALQSQPTPNSAAPRTPARAGEPRSLKFLVIVALVLGCLGTLTSVFTAPMLALQTEDSLLKQVRGTQKLLGAPSRAGAEPDASERMLVETVAAQRKLRPFQFAQIFLNLALSLALAIGAILVLKRREDGRRLLRVAAWGHLPFEAFKIALTIATMMATAAATERFADSLAGANAQADAFAASIMRASQLVGVVFSCGVALALAGFYAWLAVTLARPEVQRYCAGDPENG